MYGREDNSKEKCVKLISDWLIERRPNMLTTILGNQVQI